MTRNTNGHGFSLKDELFNERTVRQLAKELSVVVTDLKVDIFVEEVCSQFPQLELKARIEHIADVLERYLETNFTIATQQIIAALPAPLDPTKRDNDFGQFIYAPYGVYVARHGVTKARLTRALSTLKELTKRFSMEHAIRIFVATFPVQTFASLTQWADDENYHVRRLVSEGTRPRLPWSQRLDTPYELTVPLLESLYTDQTRYVTRSVANHLNDISKQDPRLVLTLLSKWQTKGKQHQAELAWLTRHALRTLLKQGYSPALELLGYHPQPAISVTALTGVPATVAVGEAFKFSCQITARKSESLLLDYSIDFVKASGVTKPKVFKLTQLTVAAGETVTIAKQHLNKAGARTRTYYAGEHCLKLLINGQVYQSKKFFLTI